MESNEIILFAGLVAAVVNTGRPPSAVGVCVTPEGRTVMEVAYRRFGSILSQSIDYLGPQNFETLLHLLGELAIALEQAVAAQEEERESDSK